MSEFDAAAGSCLSNWILPTAIVVILIAILLKNLKSIRQRFFVFLCTTVGKQYTRDMDVVKQELFRELSHLESADRDLKNKGLIRILEIGVGPGYNFKFYPKNSRVIAVDPNPYFDHHLRRNCAEFSNVKLEQVVKGVGEDLSQVEDGSIDVVITTVVLCSVQDVDRVLQEVRRVLAPGGKYYFLEHVKAVKGSSHARLQNIFGPVWPYVFDGCYIDRDIGGKIEKAGFSNVQMKRFIAPLKCSCVRIIGPHVSGMAQK